MAAFEEFHGRNPEALDTYALPERPGAGWELGPLTSMAYLADRGDGLVEYVHKFKDKSRPLLAASTDGAQLVLLGGGYSIEPDRGIVDR